MGVLLTSLLIPRADIGAVST